MRTAVQTIAAVAILLTVCSVPATAQSEPHALVAERLSGLIISTISAGGMLMPPAVLFVPPARTAGEEPVIRGAVRSLLASGHRIMTEPGASDSVLTLNVEEARIGYGTPFSESFLGERLVVRTVTLNLGVRLRSSSSSALVFDRRFTRSSADTVRLSEVGQLDSVVPAGWTVQSPPNSFVDSYLEPLVVTAAAAVAVYLFFTIRSS